MHGRKAGILAGGAAATGLVAVWAGVAIAGQTRVIITPNGPGEGEGIYDVSSGKIKPDGGRITAPSTFKCNTSNLIVKASSIPLNRKGKLNFTGKAYIDKFRKPSALGTLTWKGTPTSGTIRFQTTKTPKILRTGKLTLLKHPCDTGTLHYKLRTGAGGGG